MANLFNNFNSGFHKRAAEILGPAMDKRALDTASQYALATALGGGAGALGYRIELSKFLLLPFAYNCPKGGSNIRGVGDRSCRGSAS